MIHFFDSHIFIYRNYDENFSRIELEFKKKCEEVFSTHNINRFVIVLIKNLKLTFIKPFKSDLTQKFNAIMFTQVEYENKISFLYAELSDLKE